MNVIPAIDIIHGQCVRLKQGRYDQKTIYSKNPVEVALNFQDHGIEHLHLVDLDGAKSKRIVNYKVLNKIAACTNLKIDFGGGIKSETDIEIAFENGAQKVSIGSMAVQDKEDALTCLSKYGAKKLILGADCKNFKILSNAWTSTSEIDVIDFVKSFIKDGFEELISTDVSKDGMLKGPSFELYEKLLSNTDAKVIASGGITSVEDLVKLKKMGCSGVIIGKAIYEGKISINQLSKLC